MDEQEKGHAAIIEQDEHTTIAANLVAGTIEIRCDEGDSAEAVIAKALWLLREGRIRDGRPAITSAVLLAAASQIETALAREEIATMLLD